MRTSDTYAVPAPPPVLIALPQGFNVSGVTAWAWRIARGLTARGHRVGLLRHAEPKGHEALKLDWSDGVRVFDARGLPNLDAANGDLTPWEGAYRDAVLAMAEGGPVVCLPQLLGDCVGPFVEAAVTGEARIVLTNHSDIAYNDAIARHYAPGSAALVAVSEPLARRWARALPDRASDVIAVANGVETPVRRPVHPPLRGREVRLIYTGRLVHEPKRVTALAAMSDALRSCSTPHRVTLVGDGPAAEELRSIARDRPMRVMPPVPPRRLATLLAAHDAFVLPSRYEGLSLAMLEAMAQGCVPIVTRTEGAAQVIEQDVSGMLVDVPADASAEDTGRALAAAVVASALRLDSMRANAWQTVRDRFGLDEFADRWSEVIVRAADSPAPVWDPSRPIAFTAPGVGTVPPDACARTQAALERLAGRTVAIHGTGRHTREVQPAIHASPARIVCFVDDDPERHGERVMGLPVVSIERAHALGATDALISSHLNEDDIARRAPEYERLGIRLHRIYKAA